MLFQILDDKRDCLGIYSEDNFYYGNLRDSFTQTWDWSPHLQGKNYELARLYAGGKSLEEICPEDLKHRHSIYRAKIKAFIKAASIAKLDISEICLFDIIPEQHLMHWCQIKIKFT